MPPWIGGRGGGNCVARKISTTHSADSKWAKKVSLGAGDSAYFCARITGHWSKTIRVPAAGKTRILAVTNAARGDIRR